jgi:hypothetical protein
MSTQDARNKQADIWRQQLAKVPAVTEAQARDIMAAIQAAVETAPNPGAHEIELLARAYVDYLIGGGETLQLRQFVQLTEIHRRLNLSYSDLFAWMLQESTYQK